LIFNDEVEAYKSWTLFLIFVSIIVLIAGVVLLTFKKPEPVTGKIKPAGAPRDGRRRKGNKLKRAAENGEMEEVSDEEQVRGGENDVLWAVGDASDDEDDGEDEDVDHHQHPLHQDLPKASIASTVGGSQRRSSRRAVNERTGLVTPENEGDDGDYTHGSRMMDTNRKRLMGPFRHGDERHEMHNVAAEVNGRP
jgi:magnesium transporter